MGLFVSHSHWRGENNGLQWSAVCIVLTIFRIAYDSLAQATVIHVEGPPVFLAVHISVHRELTYQFTEN